MAAWISARRLKGLEDENASLNPLLADAMRDNAALKDLDLHLFCSGQGLMLCGSLF